MAKKFTKFYNTIYVNFKSHKNGHPGWHSIGSTQV